VKRAIAIALLACSDPSPPQPVPRDARVAVKPPPPADAAAPKGYIGVTVADFVDLAPRFQGVLATVKVQTSSDVVAGQVVAEMDQKSMQEELRAAEAALGAAAAAARQAEVDVEDARRKLALETKAVADGVSPKAALDEAQLGVKRAEAAAARASSTVASESSHVQTARDHVSDLALRAPTDGKIDHVYKQPGATVAAGTPIVRIVRHGNLRVRFAVPVDDAKRLAPGDTVTATINEQPLSATIRQVTPTVDPASGMIIVEAELTTNPSELRPNEAAVVR
jgi:RND family efflux transporter MFP subunit